MPAGRPQKADPGALYAFAHQFYWDLKRINEGYFQWKLDEQEYKQLTDGLEHQKMQLSHEQDVAIARVIVREVREGRIPQSEMEKRLKDAAAGNREANRMSLYEEADELARKQVKVSGKPEVIEALIKACAPADIRNMIAAFLDQPADHQVGGSSYGFCHVH